MSPPRKRVPPFATDAVRGASYRSPSFSRASAVMRPIASFGGGVLDSSRAGLTSTSEAARTFEHPNAGSSLPPFRRSHFDSKLLLTPRIRRGRYTHVHETLRRQPLFPDFVGRPPRPLLAGRHRGDGLGRRGPRHRPVARLRLRRDVLEGGGQRRHPAAQ